MVLWIVGLWVALPRWVWHNVYFKMKKSTELGRFLSSPLHCHKNKKREGGSLVELPSSKAYCRIWECHSGTSSLMPWGPFCSQLSGSIHREKQKNLNKQALGVSFPSPLLSRDDHFRSVTFLHNYYPLHALDPAQKSSVFSASLGFPFLEALISCKSLVK